MLIMVLVAFALPFLIERVIKYLKRMRIETIFTCGATKEEALARLNAKLLSLQFQIAPDNIIKFEPEVAVHVVGYGNFEVTVTSFCRSVSKMYRARLRRV